MLRDPQIAAISRAFLHRETRPTMKSRTGMPAPAPRAAAVGFTCDTNTMLIDRARVADCRAGGGRGGGHDAASIERGQARDPRPVQAHPSIAEENRPRGPHHSIGPARTAPHANP